MVEAKLRVDVYHLSPLVNRKWVPNHQTLVLRLDQIPAFSASHDRKNMEESVLLQFASSKNK